MLTLASLSPQDPEAHDAIGRLLRQVKPDRDPRPLILESLRPGQFSQVARADEQVVGWLWGRPLFEGHHAWELRWLITDLARPRSGIGRTLTLAFEDWCRGEGIRTIWLMTGEEMGETSLRGASLWEDPFTPLESIQPVGDAPFVFWQKLGYRFIGVIPDANGPGIPEYLMGKSLA